MQRFRKIAPRWLATASAPVAILAVLIGLSYRRHQSSQDGLETQWPMRQPTAEEAAELLREPSEKTAVLSLTPDEVVIGTLRIVLPGNPAEGDRKYRVSDAKWIDYYSRYEVRRAPVESALGRRLTDAEVRPHALDAYTLSFAPSRLPLYIVSEILFLTAWLTLGLVSAQLVRRYSAVLPGLLLWLAIPPLFVSFYSPACLDADFFYQRIVVEYVAAFCMISALTIIAPTLLSAIVWLIFTVAERLARGGSEEDEQRRISLYRKRVKLGFLALAVVFLVQRTWAYGRGRDESIAELAALERRLDAPTLEALLQIRSGDHDKHVCGNPIIDAEAQAAMDRLFDGTSASRLRVFAPTGRVKDEVLYLYGGRASRAAGGRSGYADVRVQSRGFGDSFDGDFLAHLGKQVSCSSLLHSVALEGVHCGKRVTIEGRELTIVAGS